MAYIKVVKNKAYFKRFQVKFRRRRECKTDYYARQRLITQDKNKYKTPKYRFVVRVSNKDITCQIISADLTHDVCVASAYSHELKRYGITLGLTNYAAAYATGLLLARRVNAKYGLAYEGITETDGSYEPIEHDEEGAAPFKALLDVGLRRTVTGCRLFGALKGCSDGGLEVPHNDRRFPGTTKDGKDYIADPEKHREYITARHVGEYMEHLMEEDEEAYKVQFGRYIAAGIGPDDLEDIYVNAHAAIRADPNKKRGDDELGRHKTRTGPKDATKKNYAQKKLTLAERKERVKAKIAAMQSAE
jgi:large subunit ribosomal protein L5e